MKTQEDKCYALYIEILTAYTSKTFDILNVICWHVDLRENHSAGNSGTLLKPQIW